MNKEKPSFKKLLEKLNQYEWNSISLNAFRYSYILNNIILFLFILFPDIIDLFHYILLYVVLTIFILFMPMILKMMSSKHTDRKVYLITSIIEAIIENITNINLLRNEKEKKVLEENLKSLYIFENILDFKYSMIAMGSIIEFLLIRYCIINNITPEAYTSPNGSIVPARKKHFCNYIQSAIRNDILGQRNSWYLIQNNLRNFRNYIHISKEIEEEKIDYDWYISTKSVFDRIIRNFK